MTRTLGSRIKKAREKAGISQPKLGRELDCHTVTVWRWEADKAEPTVATLRRIAAVLRVPVAELIGNTHAA